MGSGRAPNAELAGKGLAKRLIKEGVSQPGYDDKSAQ